MLPVHHCSIRQNNLTLKIDYCCAFLFGWLRPSAEAERGGGDAEGSDVYKFNHTRLLDKILSQIGIGEVVFFLVRMYCNTEGILGTFPPTVHLSI